MWHARWTNWGLTGTVRWLALRLLAAVPDCPARLWRPGPPLKSLVGPHEHIHLSQCRLPAQVLTVTPLSAPRAVLDRVIRTSTSSRGVWVKTLGSCEHGPFMTACKAPTLGVSYWSDRALRHHPVVEVPATQLLQDPMQKKSGEVFINPAYVTCTRTRQQLSAVRCLDAGCSTTPNHLEDPIISDFKRKCQWNWLVDFAYLSHSPCIRV